MKTLGQMLREEAAAMLPRDREEPPPIDMAQWQAARQRARAALAEASVVMERLR